MSDLAPGSWEFSSLQPATPSAVPGGVAGRRVWTQDSARFFPQITPNWSDAMVARTRRHIAGCACGLETSLRVALSPQLPEGLLDTLVEGFAWAAIEDDPGLLGESLFAHFRTRAALSLMASAVRPEEAAFEVEAADVEEEYLGLSLALSRWSEAATEDQPMRVDLPAEHMQDLLWTVCAQFAHSLAPMLALPQDALLVTLDRVGHELLGLYDEQTGPVARASLIARRLGSSELRAHAVQLAQEGQFLLLCAGIAERCGLETSRVAQALVHGAPQRVPLLLFRAADFGAEACALALFALRACRDSLSDEFVAQLPEAYAVLTRQEALSQIMDLALSPSFQAALHRASGGGGG